MYMAPEILDYSGHGLEVDWWAVGCIIFEMMFGNTPFYSSKGPEKIEQKIMAAKLIFPNAKKHAHLKYTDEVEDLIRKLLRKDVKERLGSKEDFKEVLEHPWFQDINIEQIENKSQHQFMPDYGANFEMNRVEEFYPVRKSDLKFSSINV